jgi:hypothetical protein
MDRCRVAVERHCGESGIKVDINVELAVGDEKL